MVVKYSHALIIIYGSFKNTSHSMCLSANTLIKIKYYPVPTILLKVWWGQKLGAACANQKKQLPSGLWVFFLFNLTCYSIWIINLLIIQEIGFYTESMFYLELQYCILKIANS